MKPSTTHPEKAQRRKDIAAWVKSGKNVGSAALRWGVTTATVEASCREHRVPFEKFNASEKTDRLLRIVAAIGTGDGTLADIARDTYVSREYVRQVMKRCRAAGVPVASRYRQ